MTRPAVTPTGTAHLFAQLLEQKFKAYIGDDGRPRFADKTPMGRRVPDVLLAWAKANRLAVYAFLQQSPHWDAGDGQPRCNECMAPVCPQNVGPEGVVECWRGRTCPFSQEGRR